MAHVAASREKTALALRRGYSLAFHAIAKAISRHCAVFKGAFPLISMFVLWRTFAHIQPFQVPIADFDLLLQQQLVFYPSPSLPSLISSVPTKPPANK